MTIAIILFFIFLAFLVSWLRTFPFREKKSRAAVKTAHAEILSRRVQSGNPHRSGRSTQGYTFLVTFRLDDDTEIDLYAYEEEYGALREGMKGMLTWQEPYLVRFENRP